MVDSALESELIRHAHSGDEAAWVALVRRHQEAVFRLAYLLLGDSDEAEDVAQETFIRAFRALNQFDKARPLRPWLLQIARNLAYNRQRSVRRYVAALQRWFESQPDSTTEAAPDTNSNEDELYDVIRKLRRSDQEVIYLRYFLELGVEETADALGIAPGTVKSRLSRALGRLRALLEDEFPNLAEEQVQ